MKKTLLASLLIAASQIHAHDLWVNAENIAADDILKAELAYGHDFPLAETIPEDRLHIFKPLHLTDMNGKSQDLKQEGENYQYVSAEKLPAGAYWVGAIYQPTFWSKNAEGWKQQNLTEMTDATYCQQAQMFGKKLVIVGDSPVDIAAIRKPIGHQLEIVPLADPTHIKIGEPFPLQILFAGEPLADATVQATSDTFMAKDMDGVEDHREPLAFSNKTGKDGKVNFIPSLEGLWKIAVEHSTPFKDEKTCQESTNASILTIAIGTARADAQAMHKH